MRKGLIAGLFYIIVYICLLAVFIFGFSLLTQQALDSLIQDKRLVLLVILLSSIFFILIFDSLTRIQKQYHSLKALRFFSFLFKIVGAFVVVITTAICVNIYTPYLHIGNVKNFNETVSSGYFLGNENGTYLLQRKGQWQGATAVAHSMGDIEGQTYVPSYETFMQSYNEGFRTFEMDFVTTSDGYIVSRHLWDSSTLQTGIDGSHIPTLEQFKSTPMNGIYTPLSFSDICQLMQEYPDVYVIPDLKITDVDQTVTMYTEMVREAKEIGAEDVLDRIIVCIYNRGLFEPVNEVYPFKSFVYTTYIDWDRNIDAFTNNCKWSAENGIDSISMWNYNYSQEVQDIANYYGIDVYVHNENDFNAAWTYLYMGARGVYTDTLLPTDLGGTS